MGSDGSSETGHGRAASRFTDWIFLLLLPLEPHLTRAAHNPSYLFRQACRIAFAIFGELND
jgi:hypothetical protein